MKVALQVVGYRFLNDLAFSEEQKEVMSKHRDLREVIVRQGKDTMPASLKVMNVLSDGEIRDVLWSKLAMIPGPVQASLMRMMTSSDNFEPSAPDQVCQNSLHMSSLKTT